MPTINVPVSLDASNDLGLPSGILLSFVSGTHAWGVALSESHFHAEVGPVNLGRGWKVYHAFGVSSGPLAGRRSVKYHVVVQVPDAAQSAPSIFAWIGNTIAETKQPAFNITMTLAAPDLATAVTSTVTGTLFPFTCLAASVGANFADRATVLPELVELLEQGGPTDPRIFGDAPHGYPWGAETSQHATGLEDQYPALTPVEFAAVTRSDHLGDIIFSAVDRIQRFEMRDPSFFEASDSSLPMMSDAPAFAKCDLWERGITKHRKSDAQDFGWSDVGGPRSPKDGYSAEHFGRAVDILFDAAFAGFWPAYWMLVAKLNAITSYGWPEFAGKTHEIWSPRAHAHVFRAFVKMFLLTQDVRWAKLAEHLMVSVVYSMGSCTPDGVSSDVHPHLPWLAVIAPSHGHGPYSRGWLQHWFCDRPNGPLGDWDPSWTDAFDAGVKGEVIHDTLMADAIKQRGTDLHDNAFYFWRGGLKGVPESSNPLSGVAYHRVAASVCVWMWAYFAIALARMEPIWDLLARALPANFGPVRKHLAWLFVTAHEGAGLVPPSQRGFYRDICPRLPHAIDEHQGDFALARVTAEACAALLSLEPFGRGDGSAPAGWDRLVAASNSVYAAVPHSAAEKAVGFEWWYVFTILGVRSDLVSHDP